MVFFKSRPKHVTLIYSTYITIHFFLLCFNYYSRIELFYSSTALLTRLTYSTKSQTINTFRSLHSFFYPFFPINYHCVIKLKGFNFLCVCVCMFVFLCLRMLPKTRVHSFYWEVGKFCCYSRKEKLKYPIEY